MGGGAIPPDLLIAASDVILLHGNGVGEPRTAGNPKRIEQMCATVRASNAYRGQPIVFNEDDHFGFDQPDNNFIAAVRSGASWGYFDYRFENEGYDQGYQSVPVNWAICSDRKRGFFGLVRQMTGGA
jgi:lactate dehydrogenase-like 2-hydroxyacid dehydrogenase